MSSSQSLVDQPDMIVEVNQAREHADQEGESDGFWYRMSAIDSRHMTIDARLNRIGIRLN